MIQPLKNTSKILQSLIFKKEWGIEFSSGNKVWGFCPFHKDNKTPNLSISLEGEYYGKFFCWACGAWGYLSGEQMSKLNLSKKKRREPVNIDWYELMQDYRACLFNDYPEKIERLSLLWNINRYMLDIVNTGWDLESYTFPMYDGNVNIIGIQRRWPEPSKGSKCCVEGSRLGIFITQIPVEKTLFICEGISDMLSVIDLGFYAIGRPNCNYGDSIIADFINNYDIKSVIIVPDDDEVGRKGATKLIQTIHSSTTADVVWFVFSGAKDIRKYIEAVGKEQVMKELGKLI